MKELENILEAKLRRSREGKASIEQLRDLSRELGNRHYHPGIPDLVQMMDHPDEIVRYNAASALGFALHYEPAITRLLNMLTTDPDADCRGAAAGGLGNLSQDTKSIQVMNVLARAALSDVDEYVRISAYKALQAVGGISREEYLKLLSSQDVRVDPARVRDILADATR